MDINFFKQTRILDGGMGQELLARCMKPNGTLWSANALLQDKYHQLLLDTHLDFLCPFFGVFGTISTKTKIPLLCDKSCSIVI